MLFNSYIFIFLFLPISFGVYFLLATRQWLRAAQIWLLAASLFFYGFWKPPYLILMVVSIVFNHQMGAAIANAELGSKKAKTLLWVGIGANLAAIAHYKYAGFVASSLNVILQTSWNVGDIFLPLAISFYTFTQIAYLVDAYRGEVKGNNYDLVTYALFVAFFPQLIAGPILRHDELIPQLRDWQNYTFNHTNIGQGLSLFILGLGKKVLIADNVSPWVGDIFAQAATVNFTEAWVGALSYTFQLYFDFSGYSDMAIGLGLLFNMQLPINFNSPYKATSISDFWRRWHITLSNFLRDYLYIPLGGSRNGEIKRYTNLLTTMLLGGLWHGAGWTFVLWGGLHGGYLCLNHWWRKQNIKLPGIIAWALTFLAVVISWVLFRASSLQEGWHLLTTMAGFNGVVIPGNVRGSLRFLELFGIQLLDWGRFTALPAPLFDNPRTFLPVLGGLLLSVTLLPNTQEILQKLKPSWSWSLGIGLVGCACLLSLNRVSEFLYFQF